MSLRMWQEHVCCLCVFVVTDTETLQACAVHYLLGMFSSGVSVVYLPVSLSMYSPTGALHAI